MDIKPSETNREFASGAVRGEDKDRGAPHLLPFAALTVVLKSGFGGVLAAPWDAIIELSKLYEAGSRKYSPRNWEKGIPAHCYIDSGFRHFQKHLRGDRDEPHLVQINWNFIGLLQTYLWICDGRLPLSLLDGLPTVKRDDLVIGLNPVLTTTHRRDFELLDEAYNGISDFVLGKGTERLVYACGSALSALNEDLQG